MTAPALPPNSIYLEALFPPLMATINYERLLADAWGVRAGVGYRPRPAASSADALLAPVTLSYTGIRSGQHGLDLGVGFAVLHFGGWRGPKDSVSGWVERSSRTTLNALALVAYRLQHDTYGVQVRVGLMTVVGSGVAWGSEADHPRTGVWVWPFVSMGYSF